MDSLTKKRKLSSDSISSPSPSKIQQILIAEEREKEIIPQIFKESLTPKKTSNLPKPEVSETESALLTLKEGFPLEIFEGRLPPVFLYSQLSSLVKSRAVIDHQLKKLASENKIVTFPTFSSTNYLIVFYDDFVHLKRKELFQRFVSEVLGEEEKSEENSSLNLLRKLGGGGVKRSPENSKIISKQSLLKRWRFEEDEVRQLVNGGYLGVQEGGFYCCSLPGSGEFIKLYEKGKKAVIGAVKKAKFGEILQKELEQRPMKKTAPLGVHYHIYDLIGSGDITKVDTTSGPLLRIRRDLPT